MKSLGFILTILLLAGCGKEGLDVKFRTVYSPSLKKSTVLEEDRLMNDALQADYTEFGDFVGTVTPGKVTAKFSSIRYIDRITTSSQQMQTMVELISTNWSDSDERRFADFTNGNSVEMLPEMWGNIGNDGWFADKNIVLKYLGIFPQYFNFEFDLPVQFNGVGIDMQNIAERQGNTIKCNLDYFLFRITDAGFDYEHGIRLGGFVFGGTSSTYIVGQNNIGDGDIRELITMAQPGCVARSGNYITPVLTPPGNGETKLITTTISFDSRNLIQHYAGFDNTPYTFDDVFVFPPHFWERFSIRIDQN